MFRKRKREETKVCVCVFFFSSSPSSLSLCLHSFRRCSTSARGHRATSQHWTVQSTGHHQLFSSFLFFFFFFFSVDRSACARKTKTVQLRVISQRRVLSCLSVLLLSSTSNEHVERNKASLLIVYLFLHSYMYAYVYVSQIRSTIYICI